MSRQVLTLRYAEDPDRVQADGFLSDVVPDARHPMNFYVRILRRDGEIIVVDTGMDGADGARGKRPIREEPVAMLRRMGIDAASVTILILEHLHFDHAGALAAFPNARPSLRMVEMGFATGPAMADSKLRMLYGAGHVAEVMRGFHARGVTLYGGDAGM